MLEYGTLGHRKKIFSEKNARGQRGEMLRDSRGAQRPPMHTAVVLLDGAELDSIVVEEGMSHDDKLNFGRQGLETQACLSHDVVSVFEPEILLLLLKMVQDWKD